ncbi:collagen alpha-1(I) chain-like isoform X1 [Poecile atricapillus]|uniref:collagen alpha-1(I) chain-like isoform X1 n=1 Tax=Poecile atricapillus TaxID=48891 RepID=UPI002739CC0F|nr:collagen alpha-1(I) chain-like isoform X1 [Poecile atricapillus]
MHYATVALKWYRLFPSKQRPVVSSGTPSPFKGGEKVMAERDRIAPTNTYFKSASSPKGAAPGSVASAGRAPVGPSGAQPGADPTGASGSRDSSVASALLRRRGKAEPQPLAAGTRRGPALRASASPRRASAGGRSRCPSVTGNLLAPVARGGRCSPAAAGPRGRAAGAAAGGRRERPPWGRAPPPPAGQPRLRGRSGTAAAEPGPGRPARSIRAPCGRSAEAYRPHRCHCAWGFSRGGCISDVGVRWGIAVNSRQKRIDSDKITYSLKWGFQI